MISILLATYNGGKYVAAQIESLLEQTCPFDKLYIQDDCSTDNTWDILQDFARREPDRIVLSRTPQNTGSAKYNFYDLMSRVRDDYLMLCDQDDVWLPEKIEKTLTKMRELEAQYGAEVPLLVHTDARVVDGDLRVINPSFKAAMNANYDRTRLRDQVIQNTLTGCTALYNRALAELLKPPVPKGMVMHDWWLMLTASAFGHIAHLDEPTLLYRQHGDNEVGAKDVRTLGYIWGRVTHGGQVRAAIAGTYGQAESLLERYRDKLTDEQVYLLTEYSRIPGKNKLGRWWTVMRLRTFKNGLSRNIAYFWFI